MPQFDTSFWVQILVYAVTFAATWGSVTQRLKMLEQKVDKHNSVVAVSYTHLSFLKSGFFPLSFLSPGTIHNTTVFPALPLITIYGSGSANLQIGIYRVVISDIDEYLILDCDTQNAYKGTQNKNITIFTDKFPRIEAGDSDIGWTGGITRIEIIPRWWTL